MERRASSPEAADSASTRQTASAQQKAPQSLVKPTMSQFWSQPTEDTGQINPAQMSDHHIEVDTINIGLKKGADILRALLLFQESPGNIVPKSLFMNIMT